MKTLKWMLVAGMPGLLLGQDVFRSNPPSVGGVLFPHVHFTAAGGNSTRDEADLASHAHDPADEFTWQGLDLGTSLQAGDYLGGFANYRVFLDEDDALDGEWEEAFLKLSNLPGGFEVRGGRLLNRVGRQNAVHLHGWDFVDANLLTGRMLGDEGLLTNSGELTWKVPTPFESAVSVAFGEAVPHEGHHAHEEEEEEGLEGEEGLFDTDVLSVRYEARWNYNDFHQFRFGGSYVTGDNGFGRTTEALGGDVEYVWRENGLEEGGRWLRWQTEVLGREIGYQDEMGGGRGTAEELGVVTAVLYGFAEDWDAGLRYGWVSGTDELLELPERHRVSAAVTRSFTLGDSTQAHVRLQYNHDEHEEYGGEDSIWLQVGFDWGGPEVR